MTTSTASSQAFEVLKLATSDVFEIKTAATTALHYTEQYHKGELSAPEFCELLDDLIRLDRIDQAMFTEAVYLKIRQAYTILLTLKTLASIF